jgi:hypothetical protein
MRTYFYGAASGWLGAILTGGVALLPYVLRRSPLTKRLEMGFPSKALYLRRMWPHYWLAYAATALSFEHAWIMMGRRGIGLRTSSAGLYLATLAMVLLFVQIALGLVLQQRNLPERRSTKNWHFWTMACIVALVGAHVWLNR